MPADTVPQDPNYHPVPFQHASDGTGAVPKVDANSSLQTIPTAGPTGGATPIRLTAVNATAQAIKATGGTLYGLQVSNTSAAAAFVQVFNVAAASVTAGTTVPLLEVVVAATTGYTTLPVGANGIAFGAAISVCSATAAGGGTGSAAGVTVCAQYA